MTHKTVQLRAPEPTDIEQIYVWENNERVWLASSTTRPLSKATIRLYVESINDIFSDKQLRLMIENNGTLVGCVDLYDFDPLHQRAGVGIMIDTPFEGQGYASLALEALKKYAFQTLGLHQLYCDIAAHNTASLALFKGQGFVQCGIKKDWFRVNKKWVDLHTFQCFSN